MKRWFHFDIVWTALLLGIFTMISVMVLSGGINRYLHPKMIYYVYFSLVVLLGLIIVQMMKLVRESPIKPFRPGLLVFAIPLIFYVSVLSDTDETVFVDNRTVSLAMDDPNDPSRLYSQAYEQSLQEPESDMFREIAYLPPDEFEARLDEPVSLVGFIYRDKNFTGDEFLISRLLMVFCIADTQVVGVPANYPGISEYEQGTWVKVSGRLTKKILPETNAYGLDWTPAIVIDQLEPTSEPANSYLYE